MVAVEARMKSFIVDCFSSVNVENAPYFFFFFVEPFGREGRILRLGHFFLSFSPKNPVTRTWRVGSSSRTWDFLVKMIRMDREITQRFGCKGHGAVLVTRLETSRL